MSPQSCPNSGSGAETAHHLSNGLYIEGENISAMLPYQPQPSTNDDLVSLALYHRATLAGSQ